MYMGYSHLTTFFAWLFGFVLSGYLLDVYCPDPRALEPSRRILYEQALANGSALPSEYSHAHHIWYFFAGIGITAFLLLLLFKRLTDTDDDRDGTG